MSRSALLFAQLIVVSVLAALHIYALGNYLYWTLPWLDSVSHFLGGLWAGLFAFWLLIEFSKKPSMVFCVIVALTFGISWEFFEAWSGLAKLSTELLDTVGDISMDIVGGIFGAIIARFFYKPLP